LLLDFASHEFLLRLCLTEVVLLDGLLVLLARGGFLKVIIVLLERIVCVYKLGVRLQKVVASLVRLLVNLRWSLHHNFRLSALHDCGGFDLSGRGVQADATSHMRVNSVRVKWHRARHQSYQVLLDKR